MDEGHLANEGSLTLKSAPAQRRQLQLKQTSDAPSLLHLSCGASVWHNGRGTLDVASRVPRDESRSCRCRPCQVPHQGSILRGFSEVSVFAVSLVSEPAGAAWTSWDELHWTSPMANALRSVESGKCLFPLALALWLGPGGQAAVSASCIS